ncbi:GntR family transcriptional regulator [Pallidibacillus pasinlerensis]|uniref:GntR family transcriptional regulator n=1 Tax=Pallidibacillus pasinlerensis TaxID=2703818 RepID=A0ABX0A8M5_9BACI|nr:GntR family transcriptional regulator [Pallidibacillus pasinlerensis]NCU18389.1 GntR family transcriptional regulator [Pallidibacillus pasinlerensis]
MAKEFETSKPIYLQIADHIFQKIIREELKPGDKLPSVREMAVQMGVNPNTIQRTYSEMERIGVVETRRGQGTFIVENAEIITELKQTIQLEVISSFVKKMKDLGFSKEEMIASLKSYLERGEK